MDTSWIDRDREDEEKLQELTDLFTNLKGFGKRFDVRGAETYKLYTIEIVNLTETELRHLAEQMNNAG